MRGDFTLGGKNEKLLCHAGLKWRNVFVIRFFTALGSA